MADEPGWKLPDALVKASAKVADELNVNYAPTNITLNFNLQVSAGEEDKVASVMLNALKPFVPFLQGQSGSTSSHVIEQAGVTATLAIKGVPSTDTDENS